MRWTMCPRRIQSAVMVVLHLLLLLTPLLTGCTEESGGVDAERSLSSPDGLAPVATITFPGAAALLTSGRVTVRGTAQSQHAITGVAVNGVPATSTDGFATWEATLAFPPGTSSLMVSTEDMLGHTDGAAAKATVTVVTFFGAPRGIAVEATGQLIVAETQRVMRVDPGSGATTVLADATTGSGPPFGALAGLAVEATGQLVVLDEQRVLRVDPSSGARTILADATRGNGPPFGSPVGIAVEATGQLVVIDNVRPTQGDTRGRVVRGIPTVGHARSFPRPPPAMSLPLLLSPGSPVVAACRVSRSRPPVSSWCSR